MSGWRVEQGTDGLVHLYHEADQAVLHHDDLDPDEAWDLGDDLLIAATRLLPHVPVGFTTVPPWMEHTQVAVAMSNRLAVVCDDHGAVFYPGMRMPLDEVMDKAREHWAQQHRTEVDNAQRSDGRSDETVRSSDKAASAAPDVHDPAA